MDRDTLAAMLAASALASSPAEATTNGCQAIPEDAKVELLERYPNGLRFLRVQVRLTAASRRPGPMSDPLLAHVVTGGLGR